MEKMGLEEGQELAHPLLNRSIQQAQKRVEQHNFQIRKRTLEYDDVMNKQREVIYGFRNEIINGAGRARPPHGHHGGSRHPEGRAIHHRRIRRRANGRSARWPTG